LPFDKSFVKANDHSPGKAWMIAGFIGMMAQNRKAWSPPFGQNDDDSYKGGAGVSPLRVPRTRHTRCISLTKANLKILNSKYLACASPASIAFVAARTKGGKNMGSNLCGWEIFM
jgi:hypothetical protein